MRTLTLNGPDALNALTEALYDVTTAALRDAADDPAVAVGLLTSSEWIGADEALQMGLVWKVCEPDELLPEARRHAEVLAAFANKRGG